jgi:hypothetical protein
MFDKPLIFGGPKLETRPSNAKHVVENWDG